MNESEYELVDYEYDLISAKSITRLSDGTKVKLTIADKFVYGHMRHNYYKCKNSGLEYYEDQDDIAAAVCVNVKTVQRSIKKWESLGLMTVKTIRTALGNKSNSYVVTTLSDVYGQYQLNTPFNIKK